MQTSSHPLKQRTKENTVIQLAALVASFKNPIEAEQFLQDFLTPTELTVLSKRLAIFKMLSEQASYQAIQKKLKVSSATVSSVAEFSTTAGAEVARANLLAEQWVQQTVATIKRWFPRVFAKETVPTASK